MRQVRSIAVVCFVVALATRAAAQVSCADPNNLCTGDPCETSNITVQTPCVVDFGGRTLVIGGALTVPAGGTLDLTAGEIQVHGRIEGPGAAVTLTAAAGPADLNTEIDVGTGSIAVSATGDIDVKNRLKAKPGGSVTVAAGGTLTTGVSAVIEVEDGGSIALSGDLGVTIGGRVFAGGEQSGSVQIDSSGGVVTLDQDVRVDGPGQSSVTIAGATGVVVNGSINAKKGEPGSSVMLASSGGDVVLDGKVSTAGTSGGTIVVQAPLGTVGPRGVDARGKIDGGIIDVSAATVAFESNVAAKGNHGNGGLIQLLGSTAVTLDHDLDASSGKGDGGQILVLGDAASGDLTLDGVGLKAGGRTAGGAVTISAPAGSVNARVKAVATTKTGSAGVILVNGVGLTVGPKSGFDVDSHGVGAGEIRFAQSGAGLFTPRRHLRGAQRRHHRGARPGGEPDRARQVPHRPGGMRRRLRRRRPRPLARERRRHAHAELPLTHASGRARITRP